MTRLWSLDGEVEYKAGHRLQEHLLRARIDGAIPDTILLLEHAPVYTVGRARQAEQNVLAPGDVPVVPVERGGDVTWHGPGQLVAYPIVDLRNRREDLHAHLHALEEAVIRLLADLGLPSGRDDRNTGVWVAGRKVCSIGIACRRWVTWHGLALNVDPDPGYFGRINPCGFESTIMTRLADHGLQHAVRDLVAPLGSHLCDTLDIRRGTVETLTVSDALAV